MPRKLPAEVSEVLSAAPVAKKTIRAKAAPAVDAPEQQYSAPAPRPAKRSSSGGIFGLLVIMVILIVGGYFGYMYYQNNFIAEEPIIEQQPVAEQQATSTQEQVDPTADWLVFSIPTKSTSSKDSFVLSFKYPQGLDITQNADNILLTTPEASSTQGAVYWTKTKKSLAEYLAALDKMNQTAWEGKPSVTVSTSTDSVTISGYSAVVRQQKLLAADLNQYITYVKSADTVYAISLTSPELDQNLLAFYVAFLNNFKLGQ